MKKPKLLFSLLFLCLLNLVENSQSTRADETSQSAPQENPASPSKAVVSAAPEEGRSHPSQTAEVETASSHELSEMDFPLILPTPPVPEVSVWVLPDHSKAFIDIKEQRATLIEPSGDRKVYDLVQENPAQDLQLIAAQGQRRIFGRLQGIDYQDDSFDINISQRLIATFDSSRRLVDLTLFETGEQAGQGLLETLKSSRQSLTEAMNMALHHDPASLEIAKRILKTAEDTNFSAIPADLRAQISETLRGDRALLESVSQ